MFPFYYSKCGILVNFHGNILDFRFLCHYATKILQMKTKRLQGGTNKTIQLFQILRALIERLLYHFVLQ